VDARTVRPPLRRFDCWRQEWENLNDQASNMTVSSITESELAHMHSCVGENITSPSLY
jgi:hypothetical protein